MRPRTRTALAATAALVAVVTFSPGAEAEKSPPLPTQSEVDAAKAAVASRSGDVAAIRAQLVVAQQKLQAAASRAEIAAEAYNGARYELQLAAARSAEAAAAAAAAAADVEVQRAGIASLAVQSFQDGSELTELTAYLSPGGPQEVADRITVTQAVGKALETRYQEFAAADILAKNAREKAEAAQRDQAALTLRSAQARDQAASTATAAQAAARQIAGERRQLIAELAQAEKISVALATRRQTGLERIAQQKAAQAAQAAATKSAQEAAAAAEKANQAAPDDSESGTSGANQSAEPAAPAAPAAQPATPTASSAAASRAIQFAKAQLGERYAWAAAGPDAWDCSGLTMMAWRQGGVSLPHYSAAQYAQTRSIGVNDLRPGDLVFWGDSPTSIHHVAIYLGNGQIIHAPRTGRPVSIDSMYYWVPPTYFGRP